ncbi:acetyltransferase [Pullulanibacillus camelliae]|uniref:Acetyltransferase n=1 Tax=Pullulanibacillus camelliae TaxID=1707096 RepID=A0A8J2YM45_9BACL|nr:GNAT family protein [Pullulanibacillus camelliae]GGE52364.1 acetyltransferase [Pullulanibacillus camelliae]
MAENIIIRPIKKDDLHTLYAMMHDKKTGIPEWKKWDAPYFPYKRPSFRSFRNQILDGMVEGMRYLIINAGQIIGMVTYYWEHRSSNWLEAGIVIFNPDYWSGGYGTKAMYLWIDHLFATLPIVRCGFTTWSGNGRMMKVGEKLGMTLEARLRKCRFYNGNYYDSIRYGVLREEWLEQKGVLYDKLFGNYSHSHFNSSTFTKDVLDNPQKV